MTRVPLFASEFRCSLCNEPVELETAKTDEDGKVVHEECYVIWIRGLLGTGPPGRASMLTFGCSKIHASVGGPALGVLR